MYRFIYFRKMNKNTNSFQASNVVVFLHDTCWRSSTRTHANITEVSYLPIWRSGGRKNKLAWMIIHIRDNGLDRRWKNQNHTLKERNTSKVLAKNERMFLSFFYAYLKRIHVCHSQDFSPIWTHFSHFFFLLPLEQP